MNLPFILDLALGLIFTYLILSLLASEIQELIGAVLQWRAEHLKRSIEVLLSGNDQESEQAARAMADVLYESPWIKGLNQEARGHIARSFRRVCHAAGMVYRTLTGTRNVFGTKTSGPSYIPAESFANSLIERMQLVPLGQVLMDDRLKRFVEDRVLLPVNHTLSDLRASTANEFLLNSEIKQLEQAVSQILTDFRQGRVDLTATLARLTLQLEQFTTLAKDLLPENHHLSETFLRRLDYIKQGLAANETETAALVKRLQPTMQELINVFSDGTVTYSELANLAKQGNKTAQKLLEHCKGEVVTPALRNSLLTLANKAEYTTNFVETQVQQFGSEIEKWYDRGMERATGVYKRNAKAVGILIGIAISVSLNADTFHIASRLATDPAVRSSITQAADQFVGTSTGNTQADLANLQQAVEQTLEELPLPLGYSEVVLEQQRAEEENWPIPFLPRRVIGWLVSGVAISMGATFWFDLLKKVVNVRATGGKDRGNAP